MMNAFIPYVQAVGRGEKLKRDLTREEARDAMHLILDRTATPAQIGAFLVTQRVKGETSDEIVGFVEAARTFCHRIQPRVARLLDLGVPYDGKARTPQLAPAIALMVAAAGQPVVLHGAPDIPTKQGVTPADVIQALGISVDQPPDTVARQIETLGIGYLHAPRFAPAWHALTPIRQQFGLRTALNTVEKLLNPALASCSVAGFFHRNYLLRMRPAVRQLFPQGWLAQGIEGSIECRAGRTTRLYPADETAAPLIVEAAALGFPEPDNSEVPADPTLHAEITRHILSNQAIPARDTALLTAGVLLHLSGHADSLTVGIEQARDALASGKAFRLLRYWEEWTQAARAAG
ncbi:anthranilate phosphoribosyltransferase [Rhodothermus profundi]|uniref:Anthranilate phosphoribosyltransferase n=1 Tax=Rhodothermus profundi TaxID=633813 RepID=A0A1M6USX6_9BACT|nr:anthranilate phosphoribosyltransferase [Rhodothermus profundi]SHK72241.1 anthranilate phosphoribosyltransferase [Rhodothermus profundi]